MRHQQAFFVTFDNLHGVLWVEEGERDVQYEISLEADRKDCLIGRRAFDPKGYVHDELGKLSGIGEPEQYQTALLTLDQLRGDAPHDVDWAKRDCIVWAARGMWGIPLRFGPQPEEA